MKNLFLVCGVSGCGKSTWIKEQIQKDKKNSIHISRDSIRFSLLNDTDDYFKKEKQVFKIFINKIKEALQEKNQIQNIYIDATHLNEKSRNKILNKLDLTNVNVIAVGFQVPLSVCIAQNSKRTGRAFVDPNVIKEMYKRFQLPTNKEKYKYSIIKIIKK